jgi:molybdopterin-containing oxidoreductase family iron-sulfur binding subunit
LESWGDARAFDGTVTVVQPLIEPLFDGRTELDLLALFGDRAGTKSHDLVRQQFGHDDAAWRAALKRGFVDGTASKPIDVSLEGSAVGPAFARCSAELDHAGEIELVSRLDPHVHDGRFAGNAWLLEFPSQIEKLAWTNAATLSASTAARLGVRNGDEIRIDGAHGRSVVAPVCVAPGQADDTVGLSLGWGRASGPELARGRGANAFTLAESARLGPSVVTLTRTRGRRDLPITQMHRKLEGRDREILQQHTVAAYRDKPAPKAADRRRLSLYDLKPGPSAQQWAMTIDLSRCTGCGACVLACQAENNVPTVGPDNVVLSREMHWIRIDSYLTEDDKGQLRVTPQPMLCQHCEMAPCEYVCPVNATVHSPDGLNEMVYNRCVGTRFCSNNCPYKVRRFNWFDFHREESDTEQLVHNPDVTVRERGVMEKCSFCVQRIREWEIQQHQGHAKEAPRTACQQTCPTQAIVFGDLRDEKSAVAQSRTSHRLFAALEDLGTEPRVRYLAKITNPNPEMP